MQKNSGTKISISTLEKKLKKPGKVKDVYILPPSKSTSGCSPQKNTDICTVETAADKATHGSGLSIGKKSGNDLNVYQEGTATDRRN